MAPHPKNIEDEAVESKDLHNLVKMEVDSTIKPILIMVASEGEQTRRQFKRLEELVLKRRLFRRRVFINVALFLILVTLWGFC